MRISKVKKAVALILLCITVLACTPPDNRAVLEEYNRETKEAVTAEMVEDWPKAEKHYLAALKAAASVNWVAGITGTKQKLGEIYAKNNKIPEAEKMYVEAKDACLKDLTCTWIDDPYDKLILFYIYYGRDPEKAIKVMDEMVSIRLRLRSSSELKSKFMGYAGDMRTAGFNKEADRLIEHLKQIP